MEDGENRTVLSWRSHKINGKGFQWSDQMQVPVTDIWFEYVHYGWVYAIRIYLHQFFFKEKWKKIYTK